MSSVDQAWLETRKITFFPLGIIYCCALIMLWDMRERPLLSLKGPRWFGTFLCQWGLHGTNSAMLWSSSILMNSNWSSLWNTCSGSPGNAFRAPFGILWPFVVLFALHLKCLFVSQRRGVVYLDHQGISNLLTCKYSSCYL